MDILYALSPDNSDTWQALALLVGPWTRHEVGGSGHGGQLGRILTRDGIPRRVGDLDGRGAVEGGGIVAGGAVLDLGDALPPVGILAEILAVDVLAGLVALRAFNRSGCDLAVPGNKRECNLCIARAANAEAVTAERNGRRIAWQRFAHVDLVDHGFEIEGDPIHRQPRVVTEDAKRHLPAASAVQSQFAVAFIAVGSGYDLAGLRDRSPIGSEVEIDVLGLLEGLVEGVGDIPGDLDRYRMRFRGVIDQAAQVGGRLDIPAECIGVDAASHRGDRPRGIVRWGCRSKIVCIVSVRLDLGHVKPDSPRSQ